MSQNAEETIRVLYVEDDEVLQDLVSVYLKVIGGYEVRCAENGQEGVEKATSWKPDFILMDVRMPVMDGTEATRILRGQPETAEIPIFALTAYSDNKTYTGCEEAGVDGYFTKPPDYQLIISTIKEVIDQRRQNGSSCS